MFASQIRRRLMSDRWRPSARWLVPLEPLSNGRLLGETSLAFLVDPAKQAKDMERAAEIVRAVVDRAAR
jgi:hypothetical protein